MKPSWHPWNSGKSGGVEAVAAAQATMERTRGRARMDNRPPLKSTQRPVLRYWRYPFEPSRNDRIGRKRICPSVDYRQAQVGISDALAIASIAVHHHQAPVDLLPPVHTRGVFLPHV